MCVQNTTVEKYLIAFRSLLASLWLQRLCPRDLFMPRATKQKRHIRKIRIKSTNISKFELLIYQFIIISCDERKSGCWITTKMIMREWDNKEYTLSFLITFFVRHWKRGEEFFQGIYLAFCSLFFTMAFPPWLVLWS